MPDHSGREAADASRRQIRGSALLLLGRVLALGVNFFVHVLIVRLLSRAEYGAFSYAYSLVAIGEMTVTLGLRRSLERFLPHYDEQGDSSSIAGALILTISSVVGLSLALIVLVYSTQDLVAGTLVDDPLAVNVLLILVLLSPITALENLVDVLFAVFSTPRAIFFRKYVVAPVLRLSVVLLLVPTGGGVRFLSAGYVVGGALGVLVYGRLIVRLLWQRGLLYGRRRGARIPIRELVGYALPLFTTEIFFIALFGSDALMLGYFVGTEEVGALRAIEPTAYLNELVYAAFALLFTPAAARLHSQRKLASLNELYWQTATWITILSYPIFAATVFLANPITLLLYGARYQESGILLATLAVGLYMNAAFGFNEYTLNVLGTLRVIVALNLVGAAGNIALNYMLIPRYGALGAAIATSTTIALHNIAKQTGLRIAGGVRFWPLHRRPYAAVVGATATLTVLNLALPMGLFAQVAAIAGATLVVLASARTSLDVAQTFPEVRRLPFARLLLGRPRT